MLVRKGFRILSSYIFNGNAVQMKPTWGRWHGWKISVGNYCIVRGYHVLLIRRSINGKWYKFYQLIGIYKSTVHIRWYFLFISVLFYAHPDVCVKSYLYRATFFTKYIIALCFCLYNETNLGSLNEHMHNIYHAENVFLIKLF